MLLTQEARIEQHALTLSNVDVKHNFEANLAQNKGFKKGNIFVGKRFRGFSYNFDYINGENFDNNYQRSYA